jgi:hypothetical protein
LIRSPWDTPWESFTVASEGLGGFDDAEEIRPLKLLSLADASVLGLGSGGADSSAWADILGPDFTCRGAESGFFVPGSEFAAAFAAIRITVELPGPADGSSRGAAVAVLGAKVWVAALARPGVLVEGAATGEDMGVGAGCFESWGELTGCGAGVLLDLPSSL